MLGVSALAASWVVFVVLPGQPDPLGAGVMTVSGAATIGLGLLVAWRRPSNPVGLMMVSIGAAQAGVVARSAWYWASWSRPDILAPPSPLALGIGNNLAAVLFLAVAALIAMFPSGRLPSPRWAMLLWFVAGGCVAMVLVGPLSTSPNFAPYQDVSPVVGQQQAVSGC